MRVDAKRNLNKVAAELLKDPLQTRDQIAEKTGLSQGNVSDKLTKVDNVNKDTDIIEIAKTDKEHLKLIQKLEGLTVESYLKDAEEEKKIMKPSDIEAVSRIGERKQKRYSILIGDGTDDKGGDKYIDLALYAIRNKSKGIGSPEISE